MVSRRDSAMEHDKDKLREEQLRKDLEDKKRYDENIEEFRKADRVRIDNIAAAYFLAFMVGVCIAVMVT